MNYYCVNVQLILYSALYLLCIHYTIFKSVLLTTLLLYLNLTSFTNIYVIRVTAHTYAYIRIYVYAYAFGFEQNLISEIWIKFVISFVLIIFEFDNVLRYGAGCTALICFLFNKYK